MYANPYPYAYAPAGYGQMGLYSWDAAGSGPTRTHHPVGRLAPFETLQLHELLAFKSQTVVQLKSALPRHTDPHVQELYRHIIGLLERDITELMQLIQYSPF